MATPPAAEKYEVLEKIGHGSFGVIRKVRRASDGHILCRKEISYHKMSVKEREQLHSEFSILHSLRHPNIVAYYHREHLKSTQDLHLYMEFCGGGDLSQVIDKLRKNNHYAEESFVWSIFSQLVVALYRCHYGVDAPEVGQNVLGPVKTVVSSGLRSKTQVMILHRDLKPENVFLGEDNSVKLGDFGLSKLMQSHDFASTYVGTPFYMSPEICAAERYTLHSDVWSLGCIIYELCARTPPFNAKTHFHLVQRIKEGRMDPLPNIYSTELRNVIESCLKTNPNHRPDTAKLLHLPMIRLMRKEREVVELGKILKMRDEQAKLKILEAEARASSLETEGEKMKTSIESMVRREWEVKARLAIDRQVQLELAAMQKRFDIELHSRVEKEVQQRLESALPAKEHAPASDEVQSSSVSTNAETEFPSSTDLSSLSLDSPPIEKMRLLPPKKITRTPFSRARTQFDSPMDIQMADPSPMSIACLSLSPRRAAAATTATACDIPNSKNIFAQAATQNAKTILQKADVSSQPHSSSPSSLVPTLEEDEDDCLPDLPTPSRLPSHQNPFKLPIARPGLIRQNTAPSRRVNPQGGTLFPPGPVRNPRVPSPNNTTATGSPVRKVPPKVPNPGAENEMFKAVMQRKLVAQGGRTLVELAQARVGGPPPQPFPERKAEPLRKDVEVPVWDPEKDEMPSPFLVRGGSKRS